VSPRFVAKMEDVLAVYQRPYDAARPVVCFDEQPKQLQADARAPLPAVAQTAGAATPRPDYTYRRGGLANLLLFCEPLRGWRRVAITADRTAQTLARELKTLVDVDYPDAAVIVLVSDNLNTHGPWCLYEVFAPAEARRIAARLEWHYTPEHGSWLNIAEIELSVLTRQCLQRRIADAPTLEREVSANVARRNARARAVNWQFTTAEARIQLKRLYPVIT